MTDIIDLDYDRQHVWHPYTSMSEPLPCYPVASASGVRLKLENGRELIDGMSSWWACIHGYNVKALNQAAHQQLQQMSHVMFGGLTHKPAVDLSRRLVDITPQGLDKVFLSDSGSVAVEVALKMAIQYWQSQGKDKKHFVSLRRGYHGDTFGAMSVCDPDGGMHSLYEGFLAKQYFVTEPQLAFDQPWQAQDIAPLEELLEQHHQHIAALILEPIVQGAGGMRFYHPEYLRQAKQLCERFDVLLIADEIATGFGRTGKMFACEHANIVPDILCLGKGLTGGYMSLAATLCSDKVAQGISQGSAGVLMHGPTFMGNPLACAVAVASIDLLLASPWQQRVENIAHQLQLGLAPIGQLEQVKETRLLGAIGVVECHEAVDMQQIQAFFVEHGVWIRPFGKLVYLMPAYVMNDADIATLCAVIYAALNTPK
ncbi:adenosylmethionine--8-amino-7-oxononanoate transaminase [Alginatibacterium sediminis]|uniref:Adenosylmethionine-8-amino-7-oxononanoate aminotransferase n=1 Tax=Alginatibacterium sediminis TaxID=2164068 RepID=A0A420EIE4_9ALTE|nr:adenosylmethionine--8-amino-7-oxononanoate transaminase [Alginatibacterium sediminis]RKF20423.1 adenosylmethionine--8-amino-7-oxononanoate transaminase [Alginatibacterium sediminis]